MSAIPISTSLPKNAAAARTLHEVTCRVLSNTVENGEYRLLTLAAPPEVLDCAPGQFFHLLCPTTGADQPYLRRPMSIYGYDARAGRLRFLYKVTGAGTRALATLEPGDGLNVLGPLGHGFSIREDWRNLLLVARGVGLATLAPLAQEAQRLGRGLTAICSARSPDMLMSIAHFQALGARVITVTDTEGTSGMDNLRALVEGEADAGRADAIYTCGSNRIMALLQEVCRARGIPGEIALEQQMACGLGMCQCCVRSFRRGGAVVQERVCREGPVFDLSEAMPW
jgi:dihydroorotate dehydrogenase electron transfer subunit